MTSDNVDFQVSLMSSYLNGTSKFEFNNNHVPKRPNFVKHDPINKLLLVSNYYTTEIHIDLAGMLASTEIDKMYFCIRVPPQKLLAGQSFQYCDFPAIKMISRVEYYLNSYQNLIETYSTSSLYMSIFESLGSSQTWRDYVQNNLGGYDNSLQFGPKTIDEGLWVVPLPLSLLPLRVKDFQSSNGSSSATIFVRLYLNPMLKLTWCSPNFTPSDFNRSVAATNGSSIPVTSECNIFTQEAISVVSQTTTVDINNPSRDAAAAAVSTFAATSSSSSAYASSLVLPSKQQQMPKQQAIYKTNQFWYTQGFSKSVTPKSEYFYVGSNSLVNEIALMPANPMFNSGRTFYGNYSMNALTNFLNTCVYTYDAQYQPSIDVLLNLRTGTTINLPNGWALQVVNSDTYLFTVTALNLKLLIVCVGIDWASLPEDVFFDLYAFVNNANLVPVQLLKNIFFYVKQASLEVITPTGIVSSGGNQGFVEGLYLSQNTQWALYGFQRQDFVDVLTPDERNMFKLAISMPVLSSNSKTNVFALGKMLVINDPFYQFFDLDKTLRIGCDSLTTRYSDKTLNSDTITSYSWYDMFFQDHSTRLKYATNNMQDMFRFMPSNIFVYNTLDYPYGFLDCMTNSLEIQFNIGVYDAQTNHQLTTNLPIRNSKYTLDSFLKQLYNSVFISYDFALKIMRFISIQDNTIFTFLTNTSIVQKILADNYQNPFDRAILTRAIEAYRSSANSTPIMLQKDKNKKRVRLV